MGTLSYVNGQLKFPSERVATRLRGRPDLIIYLTSAIRRVYLEEQISVAYGLKFDRYSELQVKCKNIGSRDGGQGQSLIFLIKQQLRLRREAEPRTICL